jgi:peptide chain release factor subunit 1
MFATVQGEIKTVLHKFTIDLPRKMGLGQRSVKSFADHRMIKRKSYINKCVENAINHFIINDILNVNGIIIAGSSTFQDEIQLVLDERLRKVVIKTLQINYGMDPGLDQAVKLFI